MVNVPSFHSFQLAGGQRVGLRVVFDERVVDVLRAAAGLGSASWLAAGVVRLDVFFVVAFFDAVFFDTVFFLVPARPAGDVLVRPAEVFGAALDGSASSSSGSRTHGTRT
jgi:hypothetical protein